MVCLSFHTLQNQYMWAFHCTPFSVSVGKQKPCFSKFPEQSIINAQMIHLIDFFSLLLFSSLLQGDACNSVAVHKLLCNEMNPYQQKRNNREIAKVQWAVFGNPSISDRLVLELLRSTMFSPIRNIVELIGHTWMVHSLTKSLIAIKYLKLA